MSRSPPSVTLTLASRPVTVAVEVLETATAQPPSVPGLTWLCSGGVGEGTWKVGTGGGGSTVVESRAPTPVGLEQSMLTVVGVPWITKVTTRPMAPGVKSTTPVPGPVCQMTGL